MKIGRNEPCPCSSGKKFKKCCTMNILENRKIVEWLKANDPDPPIDYLTITKEELDDKSTGQILQDRVKEILDGITLEKSEEFSKSEIPWTEFLGTALQSK